MSRWAVVFALCGAVLGLLGVGLGAFGAHALEAHFAAYPQREPTYQTANRYHTDHALALLVVALLMARKPTRWGAAAGLFFLAGVALFSGSLYLLAALNLSVMGAVAPVGGVCLLAGWGCLLAACWQGLR